MNTPSVTAPTRILRLLWSWQLWIIAAFLIVGAAGYLSIPPEIPSYESVSSR